MKIWYLLKHFKPETRIIFSIDGVDQIFRADSIPPALLYLDYRNFRFITGMDAFKINLRPGDGRKSWQPNMED